MEINRVNNVAFCGVFHAANFKPNRENTRVVNRLYHLINGTNLNNKKSIRNVLTAKKLNLIYDNGNNKDEIALFLEKANPKKHRPFQKCFIGNFTTENIGTFEREFKLRPLEDKIDKSGVYLTCGLFATMALMMISGIASHSRQKYSNQLKRGEKALTTQVVSNFSKPDALKNTVKFFSKLKV